MTDAKKLFLECFDTNINEADIIIGYAEKHGNIHLLRQGGFAANMICTTRIEDGDFEADYIFAVCTKPEFRGLGLFKRHLEHVTGNSPALLIPENESLIPMYKNLGFLPVYFLEADINGNGNADEFTYGIDVLYGIYENSEQFPKKNYELFEATINAHIGYGGRIFIHGDSAMLIYENSITDVFAPSERKALDIAMSAPVGSYKAMFPIGYEEILLSENIIYRKKSVIMGRNLPNTQIYINTLFN